MTAEQKLSARLRVAKVFSPTAPIDQRKLFAGRIGQLTSLVDMISTKGQHAVVYGERGVGKTSLVSILGAISFREQPAAVTYRVNCHRDDTFARVWKRALEAVRFMQPTSRTIGFTPEISTRLASLAEALAEPTPDAIVTLLRTVDPEIVFIFDEFDQLADRSVAHAFAEVVKALSDYAVKTKLILVGVGDSVDQLIESHASVERAIRQVPMPRMTVPELSEIIDKAMPELAMTCADAARDRIVRLSQGLPHYVHALGLHSARACIDRDASEVGIEDVTAGIAEALRSAQQSQLDAYIKATSSPQKESLYTLVLLACALARADALGFFTPAAVRDALREIGSPMEIPAFAGHLNKFASPDRGSVLRKVGTNRRFRYRFGNPLLQPFVVMKGISDKVLAPAALDSLFQGRSGESVSMF